MDAKLKSELDGYAKLYADFVLVLDDFEGFADDPNYKRRRYVRDLPVLRALVEKIKQVQEEESGRGVLGKLFDHKVEDELRDYIRANREALEQLKNCAVCKCLHCIKDCKMEGCNRCEPGRGCKVASCDNKSSAVYTLENKQLELTNNRTGETALYKVLAVVQDLEYRQLFIIFTRGGEKYVLYYYPGIEGDTYGEITDVEDMNFATEAYEKRNDG